MKNIEDSEIDIQPVVSMANGKPNWRRPTTIVLEIEDVTLNNQGDGAEDRYYAFS